MLDTLTKDFINKLILEIKKKENKEKLENEVIKPLCTNFSERLYPYVLLLFIMYSVNLILIIVILILIIMYNKTNNKLITN
jgi:hypothetical protein